MERETLKNELDKFGLLQGDKKEFLIKCDGSNVTHSVNRLYLENTPCYRKYMSRKVLNVLCKKNLFNKPTVLFILEAN